MAAGEAFTFLARQRIDEALAGFTDQTGMTPSVYVGTTAGTDDAPTDIDAFADRALAELAPQAAGTVLLVVDPARRTCVIRTDPVARVRVSDDACGLATLSMTTSFGVGDLVGGIVLGLRMLGDSCAPPRIELGRPPATASTVTHR